MRADREDLSRQQEAVQTAREHLAERLDCLAREATLAAKAARRRSARGTVSLDGVTAATHVVRLAEESLDLALLDLATAGGADA